MEKLEIKPKRRRKTLSIFDQSTMKENIYTKQFFNQVRNTVRNIFKEAHKNKEISKIFMNIEREFNHAEFHYKFQLKGKK